MSGSSAIRRKVTVETYGGEKVNNVEVYYGNNGKDYNKQFLAVPSARYLKLIYCGGVERKLDGQFLKKNKKFTSVCKEDKKAQAQLTVLL